MIGKCQRQDLPTSRTTRANDPIAQVNWDLMMVNEVSIEGYRYAMILTDSFSGFIWVYGLKTKDQTLGALKKWYCYIAPIRAKHALITLMRDNAGENRSQDVEDFIQSIHVQSRYSAPYEQWQDGQPETAIRTLTRLVRSMKNESGVGVRFWYHMLVAATNASNVTFKKRIGTTPHRAAHGEKKNLSKLRTFGCKAVMYLEPVRLDGPGRFADR